MSKKLSIMLVLALLLGVIGAAAPAQVTAQNPVKFSVFEMIAAQW